MTDSVTFAWLCDVFVLPEVRGLGIGKTLMAGVVADLEPLGLRRTLLATADAHGLYEQYGFSELPIPSQFLARMQPQNNMVVARRPPRFSELSDELTSLGTTSGVVTSHDIMHTGARHNDAVAGGLTRG